MASFGAYKELRSSQWPWKPATTHASTAPLIDGVLGSNLASPQHVIGSPFAGLHAGADAKCATPPTPPTGGSCGNGWSRIDSFAVPTSTSGPEYFAGQRQDGAKQYVVMMVGLPARGKTFMAQKLCRLLNWQGTRAECYNVQSAWKEAVGAPMSSELYEALHDTRSAERETYRCVLQSFADKAANFFAAGGSVVFLNDDFTSASLRKDASDLFGPLATFVFSIEVLRDAAANETFDALKVKDASEYDPSRFTADAARNDFRRRVQFMEERYETLTNADRYIKIMNSNQVSVHNVSGYLPSRIVSYLLNLSQIKVAHPIYFTRHGQSEYNLEDRLGGNPQLTEKGQQDAQWLRCFIGTLKNDELLEKPDNEMQIWTSQLTRAIQTGTPAATEYGIPMLRWSSLNEIHAGVCENMTYTEVKETYPLIHKFRGENKYSFRYPEGESYQDLVPRVEPVIMELENANRVVVVVAHQAVLRVLLAYFGGHPADSSVNLEVPHRTVWRCTYSSTGITTVDQLKLGQEVIEQVCGAGAAISPSLVASSSPSKPVPPAKV